MRHIYFILFFLLFFIWQCSAKDHLQGKALIDSVSEKLSWASDDASRMKLLNELSFNYKTIDPDKGAECGLKELNIALTLGNKQEAEHAYCNVGINYRYMSDYPRALEFYFKALKIAEELGDKLAYGAVISNLSVVYEAQGNYQKALEYDLKSLKINEDLRDTMNIAGDLGNIGNVYMNLADYPKSLEYSFRSLKIFQQVNNKEGVANNFGNIGNAYLSQSDYAQALEYNFKALGMFDELGSKVGSANTMGNIGAIYLAIAKDTTGKVKAGNFIPSGRAAVLNKAVEYFEKSLAASREIDQLDNIIDYSKGLSETWVLLGDYKKALETYTQYARVQDSVYSNASKAQIATLETKRALEVQDKQIQINKLEVAKKRNERIILIIGIILLVFIMGIVLSKFYSQILSNKVLAEEKKRHLQRINAQKNVLSDIANIQSHDVRGQVATILGLVQLFNFNDAADPINKQIIKGVAEVTQKLDTVVKEVVKIENRLNNTEI